MLTDIDGKGVTFGLLYELPENLWSDDMLSTAVLEGPIIKSIENSIKGIGLKYNFWHDSGEYYVDLFIYQKDELYQRWRSNELILFSDDFPKPTLLFYDANLR